MKQYDLIIIGGGRASNLAKKVAALGKRVALVEKAQLGGTCANRGCVPSKLLIGYADVIRTIQDSSRHYISSTIQNIDIEKIFEDNNKFIDTVDENYLKKFNNNVDVYRGEGYFIQNRVIEVNDEQLTSDTIIIATGTRPKETPFKNAWSSDDIFPLENIPKSITVVGSGFIACELANVFDALGMTTKLIVRGQQLLSNEDEEVSHTFKEEFLKKIDIEFDTTIDTAEYKNNIFTLGLKNQNGTIKQYQSEALLYAIGRDSNADTLHLENTDIKLDDRGFIKRDSHFQTAVKGVYVVGDAAGEYMLQHAAAYEMNHLYKMLYDNESKPLVFKYMPHAVFTDPEIASVGITEQEATKKKLDVVICKTNWKASAKAQSMKLNYPFTKFIVDKKSYAILGCHMIGPQSSTMIHQVLTVMHISNDIRHLKEMLYIHPALSESLLPAAVEVIKSIEESS